MSFALLSLRARCPYAFIALLLVWSASGSVTLAAITHSGDVLPNPVVPSTNVSIGRDDIGSLRIDASSTLESDSVTIGENRQGIGFATVTGPGSMWDFYGGSVGGQGVGRLAVLDGAFVDVDSGRFDIGQWGEGNGTVLVDGLGSVLRVDSDLRVGYQGIGLLQIANDAIVDVSYNDTEIGTGGRLEIDDGLFRTYRLTNSGTITGAGTLQTVSSQTVTNYGRIEVGTGQHTTIGGGGSWVESLGSISVTGGEIEFIGQVENGDISSHSSEITLRDSVARFSTSEPSESDDLRNRALLSALGGINEIYGTVEQNSGGTTLVTNDSTLIFHSPVYFSDGQLVVHSGSTAMFLSDVSLSGTLSVSIGGEDGPTPVQTTGQTYIGVDLHVSFAEAYTPHVSDIFPLVSAFEIDGGFSLAELPELPIGLLWQLDQNSSSIQLQIVGGDYNGDDTVDAADYTVWRDTLGSDQYLNADGSGNGVIDEDDYAIWKANFGVTGWSSASGAAEAASAAVPEPAAGMLLLVGALLLTGAGWFPGREALSRSV
jgi:T5SS/PEP-CTERM-associated repeat protein